MGRLYLVAGGSASGKSEYAENLASAIISDHHGADPLRLYYIAAMHPYDDESKERVKRHRMLRYGKGFETIECHTGISRLENELPKNSVVMLECMSNLLANELYLEQGALYDLVSGGGMKRDNEEELKNRLYECIVSPAVRLAARADSFVVVTNDIFSDGSSYEPETEEYIRLLGYVNQRLAGAADHVTRVVCSIPISIKGEEPLYPQDMLTRQKSNEDI